MNAVPSHGVIEPVGLRSSDEELVPCKTRAGLDGPPVTFLNNSVKWGSRKKQHGTTARVPVLGRHACDRELGGTVRGTVRSVVASDARSAAFFHRVACRLLLPRPLCPSFRRYFQHAAFWKTRVAKTRWKVYPGGGGWTSAARPARKPDVAG